MESKHTITIYDAVMGSGKTTHIIQHMNSNPQHKYIYITPNLEECQRIAEACPKLDFKHPEDKSKDTKLKDLQRLVAQGANITSTHALLSRFTKDTLELIVNHGYHLILDEAIAPCDKYVIAKTDIQMLFDSGYVTIAEDGITLEWCKETPEHNSKIYQEYKLIENGNLVLFDFNGSKNDKKVFIWQMTQGLLESFLSVTILTYQFHGSDLKCYFDIKKIPYFIDTKTLDKGRKIGHLINVCQDEKLNAIGSHLQSLGSALKKTTHKKIREELKRNASNYIKHKRNAKSHEVIWTTFKDARKDIKAKGYATAFVPCNQKATNQYGKTNTLMYLMNRYMDVTIKSYLESQGANVDEDLWSLNEMLQWIFRSAIRNNEEVHIYVPSRRMRELLVAWVNEH